MRWPWDRSSEVQALEGKLEALEKRLDALENDVDLVELERMRASVLNALRAHRRSVTAAEAREADPKDAPLKMGQILLARGRSR